VKAAGLRYATERQCIEDVPFQIGLFERGDAAVAGDRVLMVYRMHGENYSSQAAFYTNGIRLLRNMDRDGTFNDRDKFERYDRLSFLAHIGRAAAVRQLRAGQRRAGLETYVREWPHQVRLGRLQFLLTFPFLALVPQAVVRRLWPG